MKIVKLAAVAVLSVASVGFSAPALSAPVSVDIRIGAPPAPRYEIVPVARPGYVWAPGYWDYRYNRYHWVAGYWVRERPGYYYSSPTWVQHGDRWYLTGGSWQRGYRDRNAAWRDRDHDGIANRYDRDNDNDRIQDRYDRDRDGDGVRNNRDRRPDNPNRY